MNRSILKLVSALFLICVVLYLYIFYMVTRASGISCNSFATTLFADSELLDLTRISGGEWYFKHETFFDANEILFDYYWTDTTISSDLLHKDLNKLMMKRGFDKAEPLSEEIAGWSNGHSRVSLRVILAHDMTNSKRIQISCAQKAN